MKKHTMQLILISVLIMFFLGGCQNFKVTKTADTNDGQCTEEDCSLREAVIAANQSPGEDIIVLPAGTYVLTLSGTGEDNAAKGDLDILDDVVINGDTTGESIVDGNRSDRVIDALKGRLSLNHLTVRRGGTGEGGAGVRVMTGASIEMDTVIIAENSEYGPVEPAVSNTPSSVGRGAGLFSEGNVDLKNVVFSTNQNIKTYENGFANGAGMFVAGPRINLTDFTGEWVTVNMEDVRFYNNRSTNSGGGLYIDKYVEAGMTRVEMEHNGCYFGDGGGLYRTTANLSPFEISDSVFFDNWVYFSGGGMYLGNRATVLRSTIKNNHAGHGGGGLYVGADVYLRDCTVSGNDTDDAGGGIFIHATADLENVTISGNSAKIGGGLFINYNTPPTELTNCSLVDNTGRGAALCVGLAGKIQYVNTLFSGNGCVAWPTEGLTSLGYNLADNGTCGLDQETDIIAPALIGSLSDNGGPTLTHPLLSGSPAIDSGSNEYCTDADQRGFPRPAAGGSGNAICDIGAYELQPFFIKTSTARIIRGNNSGE